MQEIKRYKVPLQGFSPKLARVLWFGIGSHGPSIGHLLIVLLLQQRVHLLHLLLLLKLPLGCILHVSVKRILYLTCVDLQSSELGVDIFPSMTVRNRLSWMNWWW